MYMHALALIQCLLPDNKGKGSHENMHCHLCPVSACMYARIIACNISKLYCLHYSKLYCLHSFFRYRNLLILLMPPGVCQHIQLSSYNGNSTFLLMEKEVLFTIPEREAAIAFLGAFCKFNMLYPKGCKTLGTFLEIKLIKYLGNYHLR